MSTSPLKIAVFGATGGTGSLVLEQALDAGHQVTALVRTPAKLTVSHPGLVVVQGSVFDRAAVEQTVRGAGAVICALGAPPRSKERLRERGTQVVVDAMVDAGVRRLVVQSSHGIAETSSELPWLMRWVIVPFYLKGVFADHERQEDVVRASDLEWTIVRPPHLSNKPPAAQVAYGPNHDPARMTMSIARADVARLMLEVASDPSHVRKTLVVAAAQPKVVAA